GIAFALSFAPLNIQATNGVNDDEQGLASGLLVPPIRRRPARPQREQLRGPGRSGAWPTSRVI
ncbi:hypothetical protein, partial [Nonomuraea sp. NPDC049141]|uniref:hypothetical protein n=1 Tax=Nonomuraea sp. NPDC049141 TaxID=3155500 RepID=UPI0033D5F9DF